MKNNIGENPYSFVARTQEPNKQPGLVIKTFTESKVKYKTADSVCINLADALCFREGFK